MATNFLRLRSSIGKMLRRHHRVYVSEVDRCNFRAYVSEVDHCNFRTSEIFFASRLLERKIKMVEESKANEYAIHPGMIHAGLITSGISSDEILGKMLRLYASSGYNMEAENFFKYCSNTGAAGPHVRKAWDAILYPRNSPQYFVRLLETKIQLMEAKVVPYEINPGRIHCGLVKTGIRTDQVLCKMLRLYGSGAYKVEAEKLFNECCRSGAGGLGVWNAWISSLAINDEGLKAINVFENIPPRLRKTHSTYWNVLVACTHAGETNYAHYLLGRIFKILAIEPPIELMGTYIDGLARKGMLKEAVDVVKSLKIYKPNQEIVVSILTKYKDDPDPITFANDFVQYLEEQGVTFYIAEPTYRLLAEDGVKWRPNVKIQKQKKAVSSK